MSTLSSVQREAMQTVGRRGYESTSPTFVANAMQREAMHLRASRFGRMCGTLMLVFALVR